MWICPARGMRRAPEELAMRYVVNLQLLLLACASQIAFSQTPQVMAISHREEHLHHPENTLPAFEAAIDAGADFIEVDVGTTSDGRLVLMYDATVDRCLVQRILRNRGRTPSVAGQPEFSPTIPPNWSNFFARRVGTSRPRGPHVAIAMDLALALATAVHRKGSRTSPRAAPSSRQNRALRSLGLAMPAHYCWLKPAAIR
jgi:glycerophosphoryl diester phosphodiesterase